MFDKALVSMTTAVVAVALAAPVAGAVATPAGTTAAREQYNRVTITDGTDDVWLWNPVSAAYELVDSWPTADVEQGVFTHWGSTVEARMEFVDLRRAHQQEFAVKIKTPEITRVAWVVVKPGKLKGYHLLENAKGRSLSTKGMTHRVSFRRDVVRMTIPRSLLSQPRWTKVAMMNLMFTIPEDAEFVDNPQTTGPMAPADWRSNPGYSIRLYPVKPG